LPSSLEPFDVIVSQQGMVADFAVGIEVHLYPPLWPVAAAI
jgi:hypothetical protein